MRPSLVLCLLGTLMFSAVAPTSAKAVDLQGTWQLAGKQTLFYVTAQVPTGVCNACKPNLDGAYLALRVTKGSSKPPQPFVLRWVKGMEGTEFTWQGKLTGVMTRDGNKIVYRKSKETWLRTAPGNAYGPPSGFWQSTSGSVFMLASWPKASFVTNLSNIAKPFVRSVQWVKGMEGTQFSYDKRIGTLARDGGTISITGGKSKTTWKLVAPYGKAPARGAAKTATAKQGPKSIAGTWRPRNGGGTLVIPAGEKAEFDVVVTSADGRTTSRLRGQWSPNLVGTQLLYTQGKRTVIATWSPRYADTLQIRINCHASVSFVRQ